ncbi:MAG TPA: hypothetical protein VK487_08230 [Candidatus Bathyarchaeia archaeon]|nr:hypothetical protein [Candidatus Bathyarchaeia archaeon]
MVRVTAMTPLFHGKKRQRFKQTVIDETHKISYVPKLVRKAGLNCAAVIAGLITKSQMMPYRLSVRNATK